MTSLQGVTGVNGINIRNALSFGKNFLEENAVPQPMEEVQSFLKHLTGLSNAGLFLEGNRILHPNEIETLSQWLKRRAAGEPFSYILQNQPFWDEEFFVSRGVFIPRPETELIVEEARRLIPSPKRGLDLCTGSGCLAISLSRLFPDLRMVAIDISKKALRVARKNALEKEVGERILFLEGDLYDPLRKSKMEEPFDFVVTNPPYVASEDFWTLPEGVRNHEPSLAFLGGPKGREVIERILTGVATVLKPDGFLLMEVGMDQAQQIKGWLEEEKIPLIVEKTIRDLSGIERMLVLRRNLHSIGKGV